MNKHNILILVLITLLIVAIFVFDKTQDNKKTEMGIEIPSEYTNKENNEAEIVENYVRSNIRTIATNSPVLGGQWYVVSTAIDPSMDSGSVVYEDGHIQSTASFTYEYDNGQVLRISSFNVIE